MLFLNIKISIETLKQLSNRKFFPFQIFWIVIKNYSLSLSLSFSFANFCNDDSSFLVSV